MKKMVIAGSVSLPEKVKYWKKYWEEKGLEVIGYPLSLTSEEFYEKYPKVYEDFFRNLNRTDILFVMNENKNGIAGYIGAETFAEICYVVAQNLITNRKVEIFLMQDISDKVQSKTEIRLWLKLGWISFYNEKDWID